MKAPQKVSIENRPVSCCHCGHDEFYYRETLLNTRGMTFLDLQWLNKAAQSYICAQCGYIMWFAEVPADAPGRPGEADEPVRCLVCEKRLAEGEAVCPRCGWTYEKT